MTHFPEEIWTIIKSFVLDDMTYLLQVFVDYKRENGNDNAFKLKVNMFYQTKYRFKEYARQWIEKISQLDGTELHHERYLKNLPLFTSVYHEPFLNINQFWKNMELCHENTEKISRISRHFLHEMFQQRFLNFDVIDTRYHFAGCIKIDTFDPDLVAEARSYIRKDIDIIIREKHEQEKITLYVFSCKTLYDMNNIFDPTHKGMRNGNPHITFDKLHHLHLISKYEDHLKDFVDDDLYSVYTCPRPRYIM